MRHRITRKNHTNGALSPQPHGSRSDHSKGHGFATAELRLPLAGGFFRPRAVRKGGPWLVSSEALELFRCFEEQGTG